ncbi:MAG: uridine kinase [Terrimesophilobacter sp.]
MDSSPQTRKVLVKSLADEILHNYPHGRTLVAVDGRHGSSQKKFADALAEMLMTQGTKVFRASMDDFFRPRSDREREGWLDGEAHFREAYDYSLLRRVLIDPFHTAGSTSFVLTGFDEVRDQPVFQPKWMSAGPDAILIVDGVFLLRPELAGMWNYSIWLSTNDVPSDGPERARNIASDTAYLAKSKPSESATAVIDNHDPEHPGRVFSDSC